MEQVTINGYRGTIGWALSLLALAAALVAIALLPASASAQGSAFCQQYPNDPACLDEGGGGGDEDDDGVPGGTAFGPGGAGSGDADGNLPFTGYPITPLILLLLILLMIGLALRTYLAARDRLRRRAAVAGAPTLD